MIQEKEKQSQAETQEQGENWMQIAFACLLYTSDAADE